MYTVKTYRFLFLFACVFYVGINMDSNPASADIKVIADGGSLIDEPFADADFRYQFTRVTLKIQDASDVARVSGSIAHPYGDSPFEVNASRFVSSASVSTFSTHINFVVELRDNFPNTLTDVFTAKPIPGPGSRNNAFNFDRPGFFQTQFPYALSWLTFEAFDRIDKLVPAMLFTDPVMASTDFGGQLVVNVSGFKNTVHEIFITAVNGISIYPFFPLPKTQEDRFEISGFTVGITSGRLPLTFLVILEDGKEFIIHNTESSNRITLSPPSFVNDYCLYQ